MHHFLRLHRAGIAAVVLGLLLVAPTSRGQMRGDPLKTDVMGVFAHPDDETGMASTLAHYALGQGRVVANIYCTRGEGGGNMVGTQAGLALGILRESELRACLEKLGVRYCYFLDRRDFAYTESLSATLQRWDKEETLRALVRMVRALRPEVIVTMDPAPTAGQHGNHQAAGLLATEAFTAAADPRRFPDQLGQEGLRTWQVRKLYYGGWDENLQTVIAITNSLPDGRFPWQVAGEALSNHRSQAFGNFAASPRMRRAQLFRLVKSVVPPEPEQDLLRGLPVTDGKALPIQLAPPRPPGIQVEFASRPAIANYQRWVRAQGLDGIARGMPSDIAITAGEASDIKFSISNSAATEASGEVRLTPPDGWTLRPAVVAYRVPAGRTTQLTTRATPSAGALGGYSLKAAATGTGLTTEATLRMNVVPTLRAARASEEPSLDGSDRGWEGIPFQSISHTNVWEGKVRDEADSSGRFRVAVRGKSLFLDIHVTDDVVVTNIAPDDIKGHWRSDSVEICLDPSGGAEHTLGCYKLGVFPSDSTGVVRAARDADANPGPLPDSAPHTRVTSHRTPRGYRIQASIPFSEIGIPYARRIGFNLLIYDGDKAGAAPGENINKSRLAWAPRSGIQGRPEDWGRLDLD